MYVLSILRKKAVLRKQRGGYASNLSRKRDELKSLLDNGASVDRVQKRLELVRTALKDLFDFNVRLIQWLEKAGMPEGGSGSCLVLSVMWPYFLMFSVEICKIVMFSVLKKVNC